MTLNPTSKSRRIWIYFVKAWRSQNCGSTNQKPTRIQINQLLVSSLAYKSVQSVLHPFIVPPFYYVPTLLFQTSIFSSFYHFIFLSPVDRSLELEKADDVNLNCEYGASLSSEQLQEYRKVKKILISMNKFCVTPGKDEGFIGICIGFM